MLLNQFTKIQSKKYKNMNYKERKMDYIWKQLQKK